MTSSVLLNEFLPHAHLLSDNPIFLITNVHSSH